MIRLVLALLMLVLPLSSDFLQTIASSWQTG